LFFRNSGFRLLCFCHYSVVKVSYKRLRATLIAAVKKKSRHKKTAQNIGCRCLQLNLSVCAELVSSLSFLG